MRSNRAGAPVLAVCVILLSACATAPPPSRSTGGFVGGVAGSDLVMKGSGFRFPARVGPFVRDSGRQYGRGGRVLSVKYQADALIVADVSEYPGDQEALLAEFALNKGAIIAAHGDARLLREGPVTIHPGGKAQNGLKAVFAMSQGYRYSFPPPYQSELLVFRRGTRFIQYRFSCSAGHRERAESEVRKFIDKLAWPES
jgi:hypothetical protein